MDHIAHENIFEYLSVDLDMDEEDLRNKLCDMGTEPFVEYLKNKDLSLFKTETVLSTELRDSKDHVLINKNIPLDKYLATLLDRYVLDSNFTTTPFSIQSSDEILMIYRDKATTKINNELAKAISVQGKYKRFYSKIAKGEIKTRDEFDGFIRQMLSSIDGITYMLKMIKNIDFNKITFTKTVNSTFISLAVAMMHAGRSKGFNTRLLLKNVSTVCFMQSSAVFTGRVEKEAELESICIQSANIAKAVHKDEAITEAIRDRHSYRTEDGDPIFHKGNAGKNFLKDLVMTVNIFTDIVRNNQFSPESLEVHKAMFELAKHGYADAGIVRLIGELFLPKLKYQLLEYAFKIQDECPEKPIIWGVAGDMLPIRFICKRGDCEYSGLHKTLIPEDVIVKASEVLYETKTKRGIYFTCEVLTNKLQVHYRKIQKQLKS